VIADHAARRSARGGAPHLCGEPEQQERATMATRDQTPPPGQQPAQPDQAGKSTGQMDEQDEAVAESFPASDPPARSGIIGPLRRPDQRSRDER
jgi:hypothetical protein